MRIRITSIKKRLKSISVPPLRGSIRRIKSNQQGLSLIDTMMVVAIIFIASTGTAGLFSRALKTTGTSKYITAATYIAKSHMEEVKDTDFGYITALFPDGVSSTVVEPTLPSGATWMVTYPDGTGANPLTLTVTVSWPEDGTTKSVQLTTQVTSP